MSRPRTRTKAEPDTRITVRLKPAEIAQIRAAAIKLNETDADFFRTAAMERAAKILETE